MTDSPRIYVACLAAYNAGTLHGEWIDASQDPDDIQAAVSAMLAKSPEPGAEEWAIHDYDGFGGAKVEEYDSFDRVSQIAKMLSEHGEVFGALLSYTGDFDHAVNLMENGYRGEWKSLEDYAEQYLEDIDALSGMPESLKCYFDFKSFARDLEMGGDVFTVDVGGMVHVFDGTI